MDEELTQEKKLELEKAKRLKKWISHSEKRLNCYKRLNGGTYDEFFKILSNEMYSMGIIFNFSREKILKYCDYIDVSYNVYKRLVIKYAMFELGMTEEEMAQFFEYRNSPEYFERWIGYSKKRRKVFEEFMEKYGCGSLQSFQNEFNEKAFFCGVEHGFYSPEMQEFANSIDISLDTLNRNVNKYMYNEYDISGERMTWIKRDARRKLKRQLKK